jgi:16S rRNA (guanine527-N7)-methyltransferase
MLVPEGPGWQPRLERVLEALLPNGPKPEPEVLERLGVWLDLAVRWNERIDLTAARDPDTLVELLVADAAAIWGAEPPQPGERWVDVGSGIGAPGLTLALLAPDSIMTLIEPRTKRAAFLRSVIGELGRSDIQVERRRSETLPAGSAEMAVSRAALPPQAWLAEGMRLATRGTWVLLASGAPPALDGCIADRDLGYAWPHGGGERRALRFVRQTTPP